MIDPKLIDGSQQPQYSSSFPQENPSPEERAPPLLDGGSQLDAFGE
jgi:hypothetical protein